MHMITIFNDNDLSGHTQLLGIFDPYGNILCNYTNGKTRIHMSPIGGIELDDEGNRKKVFFSDYISLRIKGVSNQKVLSLFFSNLYYFLWTWHQCVQAFHFLFNWNKTAVVMVGFDGTRSRAALSAICFHAQQVHQCQNAQPRKNKRFLFCRIKCVQIPRGHKAVRTYIWIVFEEITFLLTWCVVLWHRLNDLIVYQVASNPMPIRFSWRKHKAK